MRLLAFFLLCFTLLFTAVPASAQPMLQGAEKTKELRELAALRTAQTRAEAAFKKTPNNAQTKKTYIDATMKLGVRTMYSGALTPREKYPQALRHFRAVLKVDPKNKDAIKFKKTIEDIYRSMGRPVPS